MVSEHVPMRAAITPRAGGGNILRHHRHLAFFARLSTKAVRVLAGEPPRPPSLPKKQCEMRRVGSQQAHGDLLAANPAPIRQSDTHLIVVPGDHQTLLGQFFGAQKFSLV